MLVASSRFEVPLAFAGLLVTSVMGIGMYLVAEVVERQMTGWATRRDDGGSRTMRRGRYGIRRRPASRLRPGLT